MRTIPIIIATVFYTLCPGVGLAKSAVLVPDVVPSAIRDAQQFSQPDQVTLTGWLGGRIAVNESNRLARLDVGRLLEGYRRRPGRQSWDGEHVGKWMHAATLAWVCSGDPVLKQRLDEAAAELVACQLPDGYLGTYLEKNRWTEWDVWAHKYNLIGLITYVRYTGNLEPMKACRRMGDLLCTTFGEGAGRRDLLKAGEHVGMAPSSVLEPMVLLYRMTGEKRYLDFCRYILDSWERPGGPHIVSTLMGVGRVDKVGNGKAYEMLSCLNGALEYHRTVNDPRILEACLRAWRDIVDKRLYLTGASSHGELFHDDYDMPNVANVGETCVTVTWLQFNAQLLRLTGQSRFASQLERVVMNQLTGAQSCDGTAWGYYVQMEGKKPYSSTLDGHCCLSSGPRGIALIPTFAMAVDGDGVVVNLFEPGTARFDLPGKSDLRVELRVETQFPADDHVRVVVNPSRAEAGGFTLKLRTAEWSPRHDVRINGSAITVAAGADGYLAIKRVWKAGDVVELDLESRPRIVVGDHMNAGKVAVLYGPLVLVADESLNKPCQPISAIAPAGTTTGELDIKPEPAPKGLQNWAGSRVFRFNAVARKETGCLKKGEHFEARLIPFSDAGSTGTRYQLWLPTGLAGGSSNRLFEARDSRSRAGNLEGSIVDDDLRTAVVTFNGQKADRDWYAVELDEPVLIDRVVFVHGKNFHDGGWFNTTGGKPEVQVRTSAAGAWEKAGVLEGYPATTATDPAGIKDGDSFTARFGQVRKVWAVRVVGVPACGDNPSQAFSSCGELQAYGPGSTKQ